MANNPLEKSTGEVVTKTDITWMRTLSRPIGTEDNKTRCWPGQDSEDTSLKGWNVFKGRGAASCPGSHTTRGTRARTAVHRDLLSCSQVCFCCWMVGHSVH